MTAHVHVRVGPLEFDSIFNQIKSFYHDTSKHENDEEQQPSSLQDLFEFFCSHLVLSFGPSKLFHMKRSRSEFLPLLERVSEAMPELFEYSIVTKRLLSVITKMCVCPPDKPKDADGDEGDGEEDAEDEAVIDQCARIVANTSGDLSRNHAKQIFEFSLVPTTTVKSISSAHQQEAGEENGNENNKIQLALGYGPSFVVVSTAGILWPGATAFSSLLFTACCFFHDEKPPTEIEKFRQLLHEIYINCFPHHHHHRRQILEIGCGLSLISSTLAACYAQKCSKSSSSLNDSIINLHVTDLFPAVAENAANNVRNALRSKNIATTVTSSGLNWKTFEEESSICDDDDEERIIIGSEVFFDREMSKDVACLFGSKLKRKWKVGYLVVMEYRVGAAEFPTYCEEFGLNCEIFKYSDFFLEAGFKITTEVQIGTTANAIGKAKVEDWIFIKLTKKL